MESFTEDYSKLLLSKEWLVKVDSQASTPYLFKFTSSSVDLTTCILVTDTRTAWAEVLTSNQFARRWRMCNELPISPIPDSDSEESWRDRHITLLGRAHSLGGFQEVTFEVAKPTLGDLAFDLECSNWKWRWEPTFLGPKVSAEILSKHLIMPLISVNHLAFSSSDVLGDLTPGDLEKATDKVGRTARRTVDTHIRNALSRPRVATTLRRMAAMFNFLPDLPAIITDAGTPDLRAPAVENPSPKITVREAEQRLNDDAIMTSREPTPPTMLPQADSATESEDEGAVPKQRTLLASLTPSHHLRDSGQPSANPSKDASPVLPSRSRSQTNASASDSDSPPIRPTKKPKHHEESDDEDSEEERRRRAAAIKSGATAKRGTRQPLKRGGKRF
ncbi:hypothetical protein K503DRAFT_530913 [Rhizopogon vinicolor AM-OR11-026]|uniref:XLF-like N-terminal domain-containing protein n=1 Tax=Rhizopogon vinicolor AM-OR11-026 TaxID=1314800 RepID=A0A1B7N8J8_9AGAM|nr:hypothetical protein K503DRAFT_530913 [Rhizopogon vinicolor AM-OR11-026]